MASAAPLRAMRHPDSAAIHPGPRPGHLGAPASRFWEANVGDVETTWAEAAAPRRRSVPRIDGVVDAPASPVASTTSWRGRSTERHLRPIARCCLPVHRIQPYGVMWSLRSRLQLHHPSDRPA